MKAKSITIPYRAYNEDGVVITPNVWCVLDGATTLYEEQSSKNNSLASKLVDYTKKNLPNLLKEMNFDEAIHQLSQNSYKSFNFKSSEPARLPSMGIAAVVEEEKHFVLYLLGDVSISYKTHTNKTYRFTDVRLKALDDGVINLMHKENKSRTETLPKLIENRNKLGEAYQAFLPSNNPDFKFKTKRIIKKNIKEILIYSDGYYSLRDTFKIVKNHESFMNYPIERAVSEIESIAYQDKQLKTYPRLKIIDDMTVIRLRKEI